MALDDRSAWWRPEPEGTQLVNLTVSQLLDASARAHANREAIVMSAYEDSGFNVRWTYAELLSRANRLAGLLRQAGINSDDRVAIWAPNVPQWVQAEFAVAKVGATLVTINPTFKAEEALFILEDSAARCCLFLPEFGPFQIWSELKRLLSRLPGLSLLFSLREPVEGVLGIDSLDSGEAWEENGLATAHDIAQIQYTSGTTGRPKGAMLKHYSLVNNAILTMKRWRIDRGDRWCNPMPFFHTTGCGMMALGITAVGATHYPIVWFDAGRVLDTIAQEGCTLVETVPTTLIALLEEQRTNPRDVSTLRVVGVSGAPVSRSLCDRVAIELGAELRVLYGLTEASPTVTCTSPEDPAETVGTTAGRPLAWTEVRVVDQTGQVGSTGLPGELQTRGYMVMAGYLHQPDATAAAIDGHGWLTTGDVATINNEGYVSIVGRLKDVIIRGGENIYPAEVEDLLRHHPSVLDACVVGVPDAFFGEESCAFVVLANGGAFDEEEVRLFLRERASHQKIPRYFVVVDELPKTASGKVRRFVLKEEAPHLLALDVEPGSAMPDQESASPEPNIEESQTGCTS